jgi:hypothetical protein
VANEPSAAQRKLYAKMGYAMPDGSFYIRPLPEGADDLENAIKAVGRGEQGGTSGAAIRKHIVMRAAAIKLSKDIPDTWNSDGTLKLEHSGTTPEPSAAQRKMFAKFGYAMPDGSYYIRPLPLGAGDLQNAIMAVGRGENAGDSGAAIRKHIMARAKALNLSSKIPDTWNADGTLKAVAQSAMTLTEFFAQNGLEHAIGNVGALKPTAQNVVGTSNQDRVMAAAKDHEDVAAAHMLSAAQCAQDANELQQKGLNSAVAKRTLGKDAATEPDWAFQRRNAQTKPQAVAKLSASLNQAHDNHVQLAIHHSKMAQRLKTKADKMSQSGLNFDPNFDIDVYLMHFGVKGMRWGVRKERGEPSEDHAKAVELKSKVKASGGVHVLSNDELKQLNERLNLESNYSRLDPAEVTAGQKALDHLLGVGGNVANQQANKYANKYATVAIDHLISEASRQHASRQRNAPLKVVSIR